VVVIKRRLERLIENLADGLTEVFDLRRSGGYPTVPSATATCAACYAPRRRLRLSLITRGKRARAGIRSTRASILQLLARLLSGADSSWQQDALAKREPFVEDPERNVATGGDGCGSLTAAESTRTGIDAHLHVQVPMFQVIEYRGVLRHPKRVDALNGR